MNKSFLIHLCFFKWFNLIHLFTNMHIFFIKIWQISLNSDYFVKVLFPLYFQIFIIITYTICALVDFTNYETPLPESQLWVEQQVNPQYHQISSNFNYNGIAIVKGQESKRNFCQSNNVSSISGKSLKCINGFQPILKNSNGF